MYSVHVQHYDFYVETSVNMLPYNNAEFVLHKEITTEANYVVYLQYFYSTEHFVLNHVLSKTTHVQYKQVQSVCDLKLLHKIILLTDTF